MKAACIIAPGLVALAVLPLAVDVVPSRAAFPGINGAIAFCSDKDGDGEIFVMDSAGQGQAPLTANLGHGRVRKNVP